MSSNSITIVRASTSVVVVEYVVLCAASAGTYDARDRGVNGGAYGGDKTGGVPASTFSGHAFGFLIDILGDDRYSGGSHGQTFPNGTIDPVNSTTGRGVNGGGYLASSFLFDADGSDSYLAIGTAVNGGAHLV